MAVMRTMHGMPGRMRMSSQSTTFGARRPSRCVARKRNCESPTGFCQNVASITAPTLSSSSCHLPAIAWFYRTRVTGVKKRVHHIAMRTKRVTEVVRFYRDLFAFDVLRKSARSVWLDAGGTILMIERAEPGEPPIARGTLELVAFGVTK